MHFLQQEIKKKCIQLSGGVILYSQAWFCPEDCYGLEKLLSLQLYSEISAMAWTTCN